MRLAGWSVEEEQVADEFLSHARAIRAERAAAGKEGLGKPNLIGPAEFLVGVTIAYRRRIIDSPSYTLNHEEVCKALEEGIRFAECLTPEAVEVNSFGHAAALHVMRHTFDPAIGKVSAAGEPMRLLAKSILVAAGTQPNIVLGREDPNNVSWTASGSRLWMKTGNR